MALRIGGNRPAAMQMAQDLPEEELEPVAEEMLPTDLMSELPAELGTEEEATEEEHTHGSVDPMALHYKDGTTRQTEACESCKFFNSDNSCQIVSGEIDPEGICNAYTSNGATEGEPMPEGEPYPEEAAEEEIPEIPVEG